MTALAQITPLVPLHSPSYAARQGVQFTTFGPGVQPGQLLNPGVADAAAAAAAVAGGNPALGRPGIALVINVEAVIRVVLPLVFLSLKLAFLLYIFGRHASPGKRVVLALMALGWVAWEGWSIRRRRQAFQAQALHAQAMAQVQAQAHAHAQAQAQAQLRAQEQGRPGALRPNQPLRVVETAGGIREQHSRRRMAGGSSRRRRQNRWTFKYWLNAVATVGISAETREMGLVRSNAPMTERQGPWRRRGRILLTFAVLFFATLVPEVEKRRRRALEKRERMRQAVERARSRSAAVAALAEFQLPPTTGEQARRLEAEQAREEDSEGALPTPAAASEEEADDNLAPDPPAVGGPDLAEMGQEDGADEQPGGEDVDEVGMCVISNSIHLGTRCRRCPTYGDLLTPANGDLGYSFNRSVVFLSCVAWTYKGLCAL
jgi:hypothetical protein